MAEIRTYAQLVDEIRASPGPVRLVGIDGCGGAGKTTFATRLNAAAGNTWPVIATDDFASHDEFMQWWPRMLSDVVEPLLRSETATYEPYDWVRRERQRPTIVAPAEVVVIEGVGATRRAWRDRLARSIWIETASDLRLRRGLERDGEELTDFWRDWRIAEDRYVEAEQPQRHTDLIVDGNPSQAHDAEKEFVVLSERPRASGGTTPPG